MFENKTVEGIKGAILGRLTTDLQVREGSFTNDVVSAVAFEICECYHSMDSFLPAFYLDESSGVYIDKQAALVGIIRKPGTTAACAITFTGTDGAAVPAGTPFYTAGGLVYLLDGAVTIAAGTGSGRLTAAAVGDAYNIAPGEIVSTLRNYDGITGYTNAAAAGGTDAEADGDLLKRYWAQMRHPATSGNPDHYRMWALGVDGVGSSRILSKWAGAGTVKAVLAGPEMEPVAMGVVQAAAAAIEAQRPVGPAVTVVSATGHDLSVAATVRIDGTTTKAAVQAALETAARGYLKALAAEAFATGIDLQFETLADKSYTVLYNRIAFLLLSIPGVTDYSALTVGGGSGNISIGATEVPVLTGVTVT